MAPMWKGLSVPNEDDEGKADRPRLCKRGLTALLN